MTEQELGRWPVSIEVPVAWGDMDALGHVNNTVYLRWFESARILYFERIGLTRSMSSKDNGPILVRQAIDYRLPITYPERVKVETTVTNLGKTSFTMAFRITSINAGALAAEGEGVLVMVDYERGQKMPLGDDVRRAIRELEARRF